MAFFFKKKQKNTFSKKKIIIIDQIFTYITGLSVPFPPHSYKDTAGSIRAENIGPYSQYAVTAVSTEQYKNWLVQ